MLPRICYALGVPKRYHKEVSRTLHLAFKKYFCVETTSGMTNGEFSKYLSQINMICNRELGMLLPMFSEPDYSDDMSIHD